MTCDPSIDKADDINSGIKAKICPEASEFVINQDQDIASVNRIEIIV